MFINHLSLINHAQQIVEKHKKMPPAQFFGTAILNGIAAKDLGWLSDQGLKGALVLSDTVSDVPENNEYIVYLPQEKVHFTILPLI